MKTHSEICKEASEAFKAALPKRPVTFAIVAVMDHGEVYYDAYYGRKTEVLLQKVSEIAKDCRWYLKPKQTSVE